MPGCWPATDWSGVPAAGSPPASGCADRKLLLRERQQLKNERTQLKNRRHAARQSWDHPASSLRRLAEHIEQINAYITQIDRQLEDLRESDQALSEAIRRIGQITGLGPQSVLKVVAETNGFALIRNRNQLASYAGLDVALDQSGTRQGKAHISKQGNVHLRRALYMPAVCASRRNRALQAFYQRLVDKHPTIRRSP
ncbi:MAG: transposase [Balneolaceae bacterium]|nr:transposase [Balneolaceae bacterium]